MKQSLKHQFNPILFTALLSGFFSTSVNASACHPLPHQSGEVIAVRSAMYLGTRVQLPANLISTPTVSNAALWDVDGIKGTNQILIKPNSSNKSGTTTNIFAFTDDGQVYDIIAQRVPAAKNQTCVVVNPRGFMKSKQQQAISTFMLSHRQTVDGPRIRSIWRPSTVYV